MRVWGFSFRVDGLRRRKALLRVEGLELGFEGT